MAFRLRVPLSGVAMLGIRPRTLLLVSSLLVVNVFAWLWVKQELRSARLDTVQILAALPSEDADDTAGRKPGSSSGAGEGVPRPRRVTLRAQFPVDGAERQSLLSELVDQDDRLLLPRVRLELPLAFFTRSAAYVRAPISALSYDARRSNR